MIVAEKQIVQPRDRHPQRRAKLLNVGIAGDGKDLLVKGVVGHEQALGIVVRSHPPEDQVAMLKLVDVLIGRQIHGQAHSQTLQRLHGQIVALDLVQIQICHDGGLAGIGEDELLLLEDLEHLAHRRTADMKIVGQLRIGDLFTRLHLHEDDPVVQSL